MNPGQKYLRPEFNLRIRKLGIVHLAGGVCHKSQLFSVSRKGKKNNKGKRDKSQHLLGLFCCVQNCVCCYGLRDAAYGYIVGLENGDESEKLLRKKEQKLFFFSTSDLYISVSKEASFCVCLSKEN